MSNETTVTISGNLTADPDLKVDRNGQPFAVFGVAVNSTRFDRQSGRWMEVNTSFYDVIAFRALALNLFESAHRGDPVVVQGRQEIKPWSSGDKRGVNVQIVAQHVGWDFAFGQGTFSKVKRPAMPGDETADPAVLRALGEHHDAMAQSGHPGFPSFSEPPDDPFDVDSDHEPASTVGVAGRVDGDGTVVRRDGTDWDGGQGGGGGLGAGSGDGESSDPGEAVA